MEQNQIEAFLSVIDHGTISAAANSLYTTQGSISKRIDLLEAEIGAPLFYRGKGRRKVELTSYGESFLSLARKWEMLNREFHAIKNANEIREISIGATDIINRITLKPVYQYIMNNVQDCRLDLHNHHSAEVFRMMESGSLDLGIVSRMFPGFNITVKKLWDEKFVVLVRTSQEIPSRISYRDLDPSKEIYSRWNNEFEIWHEHYWPSRMYRIRVGTACMISDYLQEDESWSVAPISCVQGLQSLVDFKYAELDIDTPKRAVYLLEQKNPKSNNAKSIKKVKEILLSYMQETILSL